MRPLDWRRFWKNCRRALVVLITLGLLGEMSDAKTAPAAWIVDAWALFLVFLFVRMIWRRRKSRTSSSD